MACGRKTGTKRLVIEMTGRLTARGVLSLLATALMLLPRGTSAAAQSNGSVAIGREKVTHFLRERYAIPETVKIGMDPFENSTIPGFLETTAVMGEGPEKKTEKVYVTRDGRYLALGTLAPLGANPGAELVKQVRIAFKLPENTSLTAGPLVKSKFAEFQQMKVSTNDGKSQDFFISHANVAVLGDLMLMEVNLRQKALQSMVLRDQPSFGPASAPVTIVEYADLQCPMCARFHAFLESELLPRYGDKVRVVFKEFPLAIHDWSTTAAIADQCTYQINPSNYLPYRSIIFKHQDGFSAANVRTALLQYSDEIGIDHDKLAACIDSKESMPRIEANKREGEKLDINSTPTSFINGRIVVGAPPPEQYFALVDEALKAGK